MVTWLKWSIAAFFLSTGLKSFGDVLPAVIKEKVNSVQNFLENSNDEDNYLTDSSENDPPKKEEEEGKEEEKENLPGNDRRKAVLNQYIEGIKGYTKMCKAMTNRTTMPKRVKRYVHNSIMDHHHVDIKDHTHIFIYRSSS